MADAKKKVVTEKVTLKKDHKHAGENYKATEVIEVTPVVKKWLQDQKVI